MWSIPILVALLKCSTDKYERMNENEWEGALLARDVYTYEEFVKVTDAPQCNRMTATGQDTDDKRIIYKKAMYKIAKTQYTGASQ